MKLPSRVIIESSLIKILCNTNHISKIQIQADATMMTLNDLGI